MSVGTVLGRNICAAMRRKRQGMTCRKKLRDIKTPALIVSGGYDLCTPYIAKYMYDRIPESRWELFRTCRHMCFVEENEQYIKLLKDWLNANDE